MSGKDNAAARNKIRQWYWFCVFSESYRDGGKTRCTADFIDVVKWINKREEPKIFKKTYIEAKKLMKVSSSSSAIYKGLISIIFKNGAKDFLAGRNMGSSANYAESIEIHHIFPKKYCEAQKISKDSYDNIANKTLIMKDTNRTIGSNAPSIYLEKIERKEGLSPAELDEILAGHFIAAELIRADDFNNFIVDRAKKILDETENLTGRKVAGRDSSEIKKIFGASL